MARIRRIGGRQLEEERRAAPLIAQTADRAAVGIDDAVADRQAEAGPLADRLGREERLEQLGLIARVDAGAVVEHFEPDAAAGVADAHQNAAALRRRRLDGLL